jgi:hypothetical protein
MTKLHQNLRLLVIAGGMLAGLAAAQGVMGQTSTTQPAVTCLDPFNPTAVVQPTLILASPTLADIVTPPTRTPTRPPTRSPSRP